MRAYTVEELEEERTCGDFWIRESLQITNEDQPFFYMGCSQCFSTIDITEEGFHYACWVCKKEAITVVRLKVHMDVTDATGTVIVSAIDDVAQQILQTTHADFARSKRMGIEYEVDSKRSFFMDKQFAMLLRHTNGRQYDGKRKMLLVD